MELVLFVWFLRSRVFKLVRNSLRLHAGVTFSNVNDKHSSNFVQIYERRYVRASGQHIVLREVSNFLPHELNFPGMQEKLVRIA